MGMSSVCSLKTSHFFKVTRTLELRINCCFENTRHLLQTEGRTVDKKRFHSKNVREDLLRTTKHSTYKVKLVRGPYLGLFLIPFI